MVHKIAPVLQLGDIVHRLESHERHQVYSGSEASHHPFAIVIQFTEGLEGHPIDMIPFTKNLNPEPYNNALTCAASALL